MQRGHGISPMTVMVRLTRNLIRHGTSISLLQFDLVVRYGRHCPKTGYSLRLGELVFCAHH
ncbi:MULTISPECIES: hypothetical protein [unclassified Moorena]|uniref:hypothetical protein n=1 Tax=unclassified Moorena TaxID=2683338 RepID=UPI0011809EA2|nr:MULTISPECIES: hypothetical protein [unclassified Moorena]